MSALSDIQLLLNDTGVFWPTSQILTALNEAQLVVFGETRWAKATATVALNTGDDIVSIPPDIFLPEWIDDDTTRYTWTTQVELERAKRIWRYEPGSTPRFFVLWDATHMRCWPPPDTTYDLTMHGVGWPTEFTTGDESLSGPSTYRSIVTNLTMSLLLEATRPDLSDLYLRMSDEEMEKFKAHLRRQQSHNIRRFRPITKLELRQAGVITEPVTYYPRVI